MVRTIEAIVQFVTRADAAGSTCVVHVGWWGNNPVAVKRFFLHAKQKADDFYRETLVHRQLKHRNVLELLAITINPPCSVRNEFT